MTLDKVNCGERIEIITIEDRNVRSQAIRLGISEGSKLLCSVKLPAGPIILSNRRQEIAIGRSLAQRIKISRVES